MWFRNYTQLLASCRGRYQDARLRRRLRKAYLMLSELSFLDQEVWEECENLLLLRVSKEVEGRLRCS